MARAHVERPLGELASIEQPYVQRHVAQMRQHVRSVLSDGQAHRATELLRHNLARSLDRIVLNVTMDVLAQSARCDPELSEWLAGLVAAVAVDEPRVRGRADGGEDDHDEEDIKAS